MAIAAILRKTCSAASLPGFLVQATIVVSNVVNTGHYIIFHMEPQL